MTDQGDLPPGSAGPRVVILSIARMLLAIAALLLAFFMLPLKAQDHLGFGLAAVLVGLGVFTAIFVRQMRRIKVAQYPVLRAAEAVALVATLFVVTMAGIHYGLAEVDPSSYSEPLDRLDALYFTVTTLATVGFGDITPTSTVTRAVTTAQMVMGVALLGAGVRLLLGMAQMVTQERRSTGT